MQISPQHNSYDNIKCSWDIDEQLVVRESNHIYALDCSPDGKYIAYGVGCIIRIYDPKYRKQFGNDLVGHKYTISELKYSPDGQILASGSCDIFNDIFNNDSDFRIRLWDPDKCIQVRTLKGHRWAITALSFSRNGLYLASGSLDNTLRIWNMKDNCQESLQYRSYILSVDYQPNGGCLAISSNKSIIILNAGKRIRQLHGHTDHIKSLKYSSNGSLLISGSHDKTVRIWNAKSVQKLLRNIRSTKRLRAIAVSHDSHLILSVDFDFQPIVWSLTTGQKLDTMKELQGSKNAITFSLDDRFIISGSYETTLYITPIQIEE